MLTPYLVGIGKKKEPIFRAVIEAKLWACGHMGWGTKEGKMMGRRVLAASHLERCKVSCSEPDPS